MFLFISHNYLRSFNQLKISNERASAAFASYQIIWKCVCETKHINTNTPPTSTSTAHNNHSHWRHTRRVVCLNDGHTLKRSLCIKVAILHYKPYSVTVHHIIFPCFPAAHAHVWLTDSSRVDLVQLDATRSDFILHEIGEIGKGMNEHVFVFVCSSANYISKSLCCFQDFD